MRVINTLRAWGVYVDEAFFLGGVGKAKVLTAFNPHIFFDDQDIHLEAAAILQRQHPATTLARLDAPLKKLQASFGNIKRGDRYALDYTPQRGLNVERNGAVIFNSQNQELAKVYLGIWLAPQGLPDTLRLNLLAQRP